MGSSLKELLAEEGFKERMIMTRPRSSFRLESVTMPLPHRHSYDSRTGAKIGAERTRSDLSRFNLRDGSSAKIGAERTRSDLSRFNLRDGSSKSERFIGSSIPRVNIITKEKPDGLKKEIGERNGERGMRNIQEGKKPSHLIDGFHESNKSERKVKTVEPISDPAIDEVAVQAVISILTGHIKHFRKDNEFRLSLRDSCFSSFFGELEEGNKMERKIISNLEQAIEITELVAEESADAKELKRASFQLSIITGLNSNDKKDGFTCGVPNFKLSACAHIYLGVIYKLQKRDKLSAKHLLQVFCDSPFQARTDLLPELWDYLFYPHLIHLKEWYNQEAKGLPDTPYRPRKLKHLQKVYNEVMDSGTHIFAMYYKNWLIDGAEAPSIPSIHTPPVYVREIQQVGYSSKQAYPADLSSSLAMV